MPFQEEDLRDLASHLMEKAREIERQKEKEGSTVTPAVPSEQSKDPVHDMRKLARQIEVLGYCPMLFESLLEQYDINCGPLDCPLQETPLHINDAGVVSEVIVQWRLTRGV